MFHPPATGAGRPPGRTTRPPPASAIGPSARRHNESAVGQGTLNAGPVLTPDYIKLIDELSD
ncbi:hypothetical protein [Arthrobacter sp. 49Tsu3.1M3]|uniref:hypothetical protein n=1 Tax=Arthrobacter sp. 49Tsu3.1M3 TaxID=1279029 RepID=UPI0009A57018|nr:hypothetical protein [Arthrobacter sp. 49Tsu3.1M3]